MMTLDEWIDLFTAIRDDIGGEHEVCVANEEVWESDVEVNEVFDRVYTVNIAVTEVEDDE